MLLSMGARLGARFQQRAVQTVTTNVPGPQYPIYAVGRRLLYAYPYVPILGTVRIGIAIFSYCGGMFFGITGDYDTTPDLDVLRRGIEDGVAELLAVAAPGGRDGSVRGPSNGRSGPRVATARASRTTVRGSGGGGEGQSASEGGISRAGGSVRDGGRGGAGAAPSSRERGG